MKGEKGRTEKDKGLRKERAGRKVKLYAHVSVSVL